MGVIRIQYTQIPEACFFFLNITQTLKPVALHTAETAGTTLAVWRALRTLAIQFVATW